MSDLEMMCACEADGLREIEALRINAFRTLGMNNPAQLGIAIILSLAFDFGVEDISVDADQWCGVSVRTATDRFFVPCDWPCDGFLSIWSRLAQESPDRVTSARRCSPMHFSTAQERSAAMILKVEACEAASKMHHDVAHGGKYEDGCATCRKFITDHGKTTLPFHLFWGMGVFDAITKTAYETGSAG